MGGEQQTFRMRPDCTAEDLQVGISGRMVAPAAWIQIYRDGRPLAEGEGLVPSRGPKAAEAHFTFSVSWAREWEEGSCEEGGLTPFCHKITGRRVLGEEALFWRAFPKEFLLYHAAGGGVLDKVELLLAAGTDVNKRTMYWCCFALERRDESPLAYAAARGHLQVLQSLVAHAGDVNAFGRLRENTLGSAASFGQLQVVKYLHGAAAEVDFRNHMGGTPLTNAAQWGHLSVVQYLVEAHASPRADLDAALCAAARRPARSPALPVAGEKVPVVRFLCGLRASPDARDAVGRVPLMLAAEGGLCDVARLLCAQTGSGKCVNARAADGSTALLLAAANGHLETVRFLCEEARADPGLAQHSGVSPLLAAGFRRQGDVLAYLRAREEASPGARSELH